MLRRFLGLASSVEVIESDLEPLAHGDLTLAYPHAWVVKLYQ